MDRLFRASAEEFEPPYNPDDWADMRRRLDDDDRSRFIDRFVYWGLPILLLLVTAVSLLTREPASFPAGERPTGAKPSSGSPSSGNPAASVPADGSAGSPARASAPETTSSASPETASAPVISDGGASGFRPVEPADRSGSRSTRPESTPATSRPGGKRVTSAAPVPGRRRSVPGAADNAVGGKTKITKTGAASRPTRYDLKIQPESIPAGTPSRTVNRSNGGRQNPPADLRLSGTVGNVGETTRPSGRGTARPGNVPSATGQTPGAADAGTVPVSAPSAPESDRFRLSTDPALLAARGLAVRTEMALPEVYFEPVPPPVRTGPALPSVPVVGFPAISVRAVGFTDLNFVGKSKDPALNAGYGLLGEYRFLRRFTIQTGVLRSVKKYTAPGNAYTYPSHWYQSFKPESVGAVCTILDIPVNLRFDLLLNERRRWFVSSGVSSYYMQKEDYKYKYPYGTTGIRYWGWNGHTDWFVASHLNLSVGYERSFSTSGPFRRFSWQAEPFLKAPFQGVGFGKIRLTSAGIFFSVRYRL
ncbi:hypothetical protein [Larkinella soli]|uniref:hypothetical protein n=1 Tax=Larkinella soli TaxID=1770527 RepID=UPI000FFB5FFF|nr:hypothetical protein [Larkinella soli]